MLLQRRSRLPWHRRRSCRAALLSRRRHRPNRSLRLRSSRWCHRRHRPRHSRTALLLKRRAFPSTPRALHCKRVLNRSPAASPARSHSALPPSPAAIGMTTTRRRRCLTDPMRNRPRPFCRRPPHALLIGSRPLRRHPAPQAPTPQLSPPHRLSRRPLRVRACRLCRLAVPWMAPAASRRRAPSAHLRQHRVLLPPRRFHLQDPCRVGAPCPPQTACPPRG